MGYYDDMSYQELLMARAAGRGVSDVELTRARRREEKAAAEADEARTLARDQAKAEKAYQTMVEGWVAEAVERATPLHERLKVERDAYQAADTAVAEAVKARAAALAKVNGTFGEIAEVVREHLGDGRWATGPEPYGFPRDEHGNPAVSTYATDHRIVVDGVVIGALADQPDPLFAGGEE